MAGGGGVEGEIGSAPTCPSDGRGGWRSVTGRDDLESLEIESLEIGVAGEEAAGPGLGVDGHGGLFQRHPSVGLEKASV